jgi:hypothetical protein
MATIFSAEEQAIIDYVEGSDAVSIENVDTDKYPGFPMGFAVIVLYLAH